MTAERIDNPAGVVRFEEGWRWYFWRNAAGVPCVSCRPRPGYAGERRGGRATVVAINRADRVITIAGEEPPPPLHWPRPPRGQGPGGPPNRHARRAAGKQR